MSLKQTVRTFLELSKSGIVTLVLISVLGGYLIGQPMELPFSLSRMLWTLVGVLFLASGSSALNQFQEQTQDAAMPRTSSRPLPSGRIAPYQVAVFIAVFLGLGLLILARLGGELLALGAAAVVFYNGFYTLWWKRRWAYAAIPGAIPGAIPILMGYASANGHVWTPGGIYLFLILFFWQMPHFWVLALRFQKDYALGNFPTLPVALGEDITVLQILLWCLAYVGLAIVGPLFLPVGIIYLIITIPMCAWLLWKLRLFVMAEAKTSGKAWLGFFLWVNFSLIIFIAAAALDIWHLHLMTPIWTR
jgi:protoheme IX farnesyltransferase